MKKGMLIAVSAGLLCANAVMAHAEDGTVVNEESVSKGYVALKAGQFKPNTDYGTTSSGLKNFDPGMNYEIAWGQKTNKYFAFDFGLGYYSVSAKSGSGAKTSVLDFTVSAIGILPISSVDLFAGLGGGVYSATLKSTGTDATSGALGYQLLAGADINITKSIAIGGEVKYFQAKPEFKVVQTGEKVKINVGGTTYNGVLKYRF